MNSFKSLQALKKHIEKTAMTLPSVKKVVSATLASEGRRFKEILQKWVDAYYDSYKPVTGVGGRDSYKYEHGNDWERTGALLNSITITTMKLSGNKLSLDIYFDENVATHNSIFGGEPAYVPVLIDEGWEWQNNPHIKHLSEYEGFHFVDKAIAEYNKNNPYGISIEKYQK